MATALGWKLLGMFGLVSVLLIACGGGGAPSE